MQVACTAYKEEFLLPPGHSPSSRSPTHFRPVSQPFPSLVHASRLTDVYWGTRGTNRVRVSVGKSVKTAAVTVMTFRDRCTRPVVIRPPQRTRTHRPGVRVVTTQSVSVVESCPLPRPPPHVPTLAGCYNGILIRAISNDPLIIQL